MMVGSIAATLRALGLRGFVERAKKRCVVTSKRATQQIVDASGERVFQLASCGEGRFDSRRRVNLSIVGGSVVQIELKAELTMNYQVVTKTVSPQSLAAVRRRV